MENTTLQILVQGGLASVALVSVYLNYKLVSNHFIHLQEVLSRLTETLGELKEAIKEHFQK